VTGQARPVRNGEPPAGTSRSTPCEGAFTARSSWWWWWCRVGLVWCAVSGRGICAVPPGGVRDGARTARPVVLGIFSGEGEGVAESHGAPLLSAAGSFVLASGVAVCPKRSPGDAFSGSPAGEAALDLARADVLHPGQHRPALTEGSTIEPNRSPVTNVDTSSRRVAPAATCRCALTEHLAAQPAVRISVSRRRSGGPHARCSGACAAWSGLAPSGC